MKKWIGYDDDIEEPNGRTLIQQHHKKKNNHYVQSVSIPVEIRKFLDSKRHDELAWIGLTVGTESSHQDVVVCFIVDKMKYPPKQFKRILELLSE